MSICKKALAFSAVFMICFLAASHSSAAKNSDVRITSRAADGRIKIELENICNYYLGNVYISLTDGQNQTIPLSSPTDAVDPENAASSDITSVASGDSLAALNEITSETTYTSENDGTGYVRSVPPEESVRFIADISGDSEETDTVGISSGGQADSVQSGPFIAAGAAVIVILLVILIVKKGGKGASVSVIALILAGAVTGYSDSGVSSADSGETTTTETTTTVELSEPYGGRIKDVIEANGAVYTVTADYTVIPAAVTHPLKNNRIPSSKEDYNIPSVPQQRLVENSGPLTEHGIYIGKNDFMFYGDSISDYTGKSMLTDAKLQKLSRMLNERDEWAKANDIKLYFAICPDKTSVYYDYVPEKVHRAETDPTDAVIGYLNENCSVEVIDLRKTLVDAREEYGDTLFYKYDTHWNNNGGFAAYREIMRRINEDIPGAYTLSKDDFEITEYETYMKDMAYYLGFYSKYVDYGPVYTLKNGMTATLTDSYSDGYWGQFVFCSRWDDGYSDALKYVKYENVYNDEAPSLYVYRDSFSIALIHFLKDSFSSSVFDWSFDFNRQEIIDSGADIVVMQAVEKSIPEFTNSRTFSN